MTAPTNYNGAGTDMRIDQSAMFAYATVEVPNAARAIAGAIGAIQTIWRDLAVGWMGRSADEAQAFVSRWNAVVSRLYGTEADPESGALARIAQAVAVAAVNFGVAEDTNQRMFLSLTSGLQAPPGPVDAPARNHTDAPVTQYAPAPP